MNTMMKNMFLKLSLISLFFAIVACEKYNDQVKVEYAVKGLTKKFKVYYYDANNQMVKIDSVVNKNWSYSYMADKGKILYMYVRYSEIVSNASRFQVRIIVDGVVYKEAYAFDEDKGIINNDSLRYQIIRSGTVPY
jgi:hypothetical protein